MKKLFALVFALMFSLSVQADDETLNLYIYSEYIPDSVFADFTGETGIKMNVSTFEDEEELYNKMRLTGGEGYDLIMSASENLASLIRLGLLHKLDKSKITNFKNLLPITLGRDFDRNNDYTVPFAIGTGSFAVNTKKVDISKLKSFADLGRPEFKGRLLLLNSMRTVLGIGLFMNGHSINDRNEEHIEQAYETLRDKILPNVRTFANESSIQALLNGEVDIAQTWDGLAFAANEENPDIQYIHMKEGISLWIDSWAIPAKSSNIAGAYKFLDYVLRGSVSALISEEYQYGPVNSEAIKLLPKAITESPILNLTPEQQKYAEFEGDLGNALSIYDKYWVLLRSEK